MIIDYLNALKNKGNFTYEAIAKLSGIPEATVKNIITGKTEDPRFETLSKIVYAMGGSMDEINNREKGDDVEMNLVLTIKEIYDARIKDYEARLAAAKENSQGRIEDLKESHDKHIETLKTSNKRLWITAAGILGFVITIIMVDVLVGNIGWFRY